MDPDSPDRDWPSPRRVVCGIWGAGLRAAIFAWTQLLDSQLGHHVRVVLGRKFSKPLTLLWRQLPRHRGGGRGRLGLGRFAVKKDSCTTKNYLVAGKGDGVST